MRAQHVAAGRARLHASHMRLPRGAACCPQCTWSALSVLRLSCQPICVQPQPAYYQYAPPQYYQVSALPTLPPGSNITRRCMHAADATAPAQPMPRQASSAAAHPRFPPSSHRLQAYPGGYAPAGAPPPGHPAYGVAQSVPVSPPGAAGMPPPAAHGVPPSGAAAGPAAPGAPAGAVPAAAADAPDFDHMSVGDLKQFIASRGAKLEVGACWAALAAVASAAAAGTTAAAAAAGRPLPGHPSLLMSSRPRMIAAAANGSGSRHGGYCIPTPHL